MPHGDYRVPQQTPVMTGMMVFEADDQARAVIRNLFAELDRDSNGYLSTHEMRSAQEVMLRTCTNVVVGGGGADLTDDLPRMLRSMDANRDGRIDWAEWEDFARSVYEVAGRKRFITMVERWLERLTGLSSRPSLERCENRHRPSISQAIPTRPNPGLPIMQIVPLGSGRMHAPVLAQVQAGNIMAGSAGPRSYTGTVPTPQHAAAATPRSMWNPSGPTAAAAGLILQGQRPLEAVAAAAAPTNGQALASPGGRQSQQQDSAMHGTGKSRAVPKLPSLVGAGVRTVAAAPTGLASDAPAGADEKRPQRSERLRSAPGDPLDAPSLPPGHPQTSSASSEHSLLQSAAWADLDGPFETPAERAPANAQDGDGAAASAAVGQCRSPGNHLSAVLPMVAEVDSAAAPAVTALKCGSGHQFSATGSAVAQALLGSSAIRGALPSRDPPSEVDLLLDPSPLCSGAQPGEEGGPPDEVMRDVEQIVVELTASRERPTKRKHSVKGSSHQVHSLPCAVDKPAHSPKSASRPRSSSPVAGKSRRSTGHVASMSRSRAAPQGAPAGQEAKATLDRGGGGVEEEEAALTPLLSEDEEHSQNAECPVPALLSETQVSAESSEQPQHRVQRADQPQVPASPKADNLDHAVGAIVKIQAARRGTVARRHFAQEKSLTLQAASRIQSTFRGKRSRREMANAQLAPVADGEAPLRAELPPTSMDEAWELMTMQMGFVTNQLGVSDFMVTYNWCKETGLGPALPRCVPQELSEAIASTEAPNEDLTVGEFAHLCTVLIDTPSMQDSEVHESLIQVQDQCKEMLPGEFSVDMKETLGFAVFKRIIWLITFYTHMDEQHILAHLAWVQTGGFEMTGSMACVVMERVFKRKPASNRGVLEQVIQNNDFLKMCYLANLVDKHARAGLPYSSLGLLFNSTVKKMPEILAARAKAHAAIRGTKPLGRKYQATPRAFSIPLSIRGIAGRLELSVLFDEFFKLLPPGLFRSPLLLVLYVINAVSNSQK